MQRGQRGVCTLGPVGIAGNTTIDKRKSCSVVVRFVFQIKMLCRLCGLGQQGRSKNRLRKVGREQLVSYSELGLIKASRSSARSKATKGRGQMERRAASAHKARLQGDTVQAYELRFALVSV